MSDKNPAPDSIDKALRKIRIENARRSCRVLGGVLVAFGLFFAMDFGHRPTAGPSMRFFVNALYDTFGNWGPVLVFLIPGLIFIAVSLGGGDQDK
jgi:hypothetical protein